MTWRGTIIGYGFRNLRPVSQETFSKIVTKVKFEIEICISTINYGFLDFSIVTL